MATNDVPGANPSNRDVLAVGCWAEHADGSLILVEGLEGRSVIYSVFDVAQDPPVEYRDAMPEKGFKERFSYDSKSKDRDVWTWHDKTSFPWDRIMADFPSGSRHSSAVGTLTAAQRIARSLELQAQAVAERHELFPTQQNAARTLMQRFKDGLDAFKQ